jgi:Mrp family chromosome partitioning ATPase
MELIRQALDRSLAERAAGDRTPASSTRVAAEPGPATPPAAITRKVALDADVLRRARINGPDGRGPTTRPFKLLRTQVLQRMRREGLRSLAVVSPGSGEGKTTTALNLGIAIGEGADDTALVVDFSLRRPGVASTLGIAVEAGVEDCLQGRSTVAEALVAPRGYRGFTLLPAGRPVEQSSELLASAGTRALVGEIVRRYENRIVIVDLPGLLVDDDALAILPAVDAALLVVREGGTRRADLEQALHLLGRTVVVGTRVHGSRAGRPER